MDTFMFVVVFILVFVFLLGFFPIIFYVIWSVQNKGKRKAAKIAAAEGHAKHYHITKLKELRDNPRIKL